MASFQERVGQALQRLREQRGLSMRQVGEPCGMKAQNIGPIEKARRGVRTDTLGKLLDAMGANLLDLYQAMNGATPVAGPTEAAVGEVYSLLSESDTLGVALRLLREQRDLSFDDVGQQLGVRARTIWEYESGVALRLSTLERLLDTYNASLVDLHTALTLAQYLQGWKRQQVDARTSLRLALHCLDQLVPDSEEGLALDAAGEARGFEKLLELRSALSAQD